MQNYPLFTSECWLSAGRWGVAVLQWSWPPKRISTLQKEFGIKQEIFSIIHFGVFMESNSQEVNSPWMSASELIRQLGQTRTKALRDFEHHNSPHPWSIIYWHRDVKDWENRTRASIDSIKNRSNTNWYDSLYVAICRWHFRRQLCHSHSKWNGIHRCL